MLRYAAGGYGLMGKWLNQSEGIPRDTMGK